jgi:hypothetical protein
VVWCLDGIHRDRTVYKPQRVQSLGTGGRLQQTYDIFEGTEPIQQLVISRAISGLCIE